MNRAGDSIEDRWKLDNGGNLAQARNDSVAEGAFGLDIAGAKALKERLGLNGTGEATPAPADVDIPAGAPPVYHWTGKRPAPESGSPEGEDDSAPRRASLFSRLSLSFR
jgi:hypothetical protein